MGAALLVIFQWRLRVRLGKKRLLQGDTNRQVLSRWVRLERICGLLKIAPSEDCLTLAQKAKFSQYTMTEEELAVMDMALQQTSKQLKKKHVFLQIYCTVILALY